MQYWTSHPEKGSPVISRWVFVLIAAIVTGLVTTLWLFPHRRTVRQPATELRKFFSSQAIRYQSAYAELVTPLDPRLVRYILMNVEAYYANLVPAYFPSAGQIPLTLYVTRGRAELNDMASKRRGVSLSSEELGVYYPGDGLALTYYESGEPGVMSWLTSVFHEITHHLVHLNYPNAPYWFDEGLANYFGERTKIVKGRALQQGLDPWSEQSAQWFDPEEIDVRHMLALPEKEFRDSWQARAVARWLFYWLERRGQLATYLRQVKRAGYGERSLETATGLTIATITEALRDLHRKEAVPFANLYQGMLSLSPLRRLEAYWMAIAAMPDNTRVHYELAKHWLWNQRADKVYEALQPVLAHQDSAEYLHAAWLMGNAYLAESRPAQALPFYFQALDYADYDEHQYQLYRQIKVCYELLGDGERARQWHRHAVADDWSAGMYAMDQSDLAHQFPLLNSPEDTAHFHLLTAIDRRFTAYLSMNAEAYYSQVVARYFPETKPEPITVYYTRTSHQAERLLEDIEGVAATYNANEGIALAKSSRVYLHYEWGRGEEERLGWQALFRQIARLLIWRNYPDSPSWFSAGLSEYLGGEAQLVKGTLFLDRPSGPVGYHIRQSLQKGGQISVTDVLDMSERKFWQAPEARDVACLLFRWLDHQEKLGVYLELVRRAEYGGALVQVTGRSLKDLDSELTEFFERHYTLPALVEYAHGQRGEASLVAYQAADRVRQDYPPVLEGLAFHALARGDFATAATLLARVVTDPTYPWRGYALRNLAAAFKLQGKVEEALPYFAMALDYSDAHEKRYQLFQLIGECYEMQGDLATARQWYRLYLAHDWEQDRHPQLVAYVRSKLGKEEVLPGEVNFIW